MADKALLNLLEGSSLKAVDLLERDVGQSPGNAASWNDLASAYLINYQEKGRAIDLFHAFVAVSRALSINPRLPEAAFNRSLVLQFMHLESPAREAWNYYNHIDEESPWGEEARKRHGELREKPEQLSHRELLDLFRSCIEKRDWRRIYQLTSQYRRTARLIAEEDLLRSLEKRESPEDQDYQIARTIADAVAASGDLFLQDSLVALEEASRDPYLSRLLTTGLSSLAAGQKEYAEGNYRKAEDLFEDAVLDLVQTKHPFSLKAIYHLGCALHFQARRKEAIEKFSLVTRRAKDKGYWSLHAEALWMRGLSNFGLGALGTSLDDYTRALAVFGQLGEEESSAGIHFLLAESLDFQGAREESWYHCKEALRIAAHLDDPLRKYQIYSVAATVSFHGGATELSLILEEEAVKNARKIKNPIALATALAWLVRYKARVGASESAFPDLAEARRVASKVPSGPARTRVFADVLLAEADLRTESDPTDVVRILDEVIARNEDAESKYHEIEVLLARSRALYRLGDLTSALRDLERCVEIIEQRRASISQDALRISFLDLVHEVYEESVDVAMRLGYAARAFELAEKGRARQLLELISSAEGSSFITEAKHQGSRIGAFGVRLPKDVVIVEYSVVDDHLYSWVIGNGGLLDARRLAIKSQELRSAVFRFRNSLEEGADSAKVDSEYLYSVLIEPVAQSVSSGMHIVFVPDSFLFYLPFAALRSTVTGRYLFEEHSSSLSFSVASYVAAMGKKVDAANNKKILLVGNPSINRTSSLDLLDLPASELEVNQLESLYASSATLKGADATKSNVMKEIRLAGIAHLSGHVIIRRDSPLRSFFALAPDPADRLGRLYVSDIYRDNLGNLSLVILSACDSALGSISESEGMLGFSRAFIASGASAVVGSLWEVEDSYSKVFLLEFHQGLRKGLDPAKALRSAQLRFATSGGPVNWAAFTLIGGSYE